MKVSDSQAAKQKWSSLVKEISGFIPTKKNRGRKTGGKMTEELRKETAFHEAGHAAVATALGLNVLWVAMPPLVPNGRTCYEAEIGAEDLATVIAGEASAAKEYDDCDLVKTISTLYVVPSMYKNSTDFMWIKDHYKADEALAAIENAEKILHDHWRKVNEIARRLMTRDYIDGMELRRMW
jgi:hypothetical protein